MQISRNWRKLPPMAAAYIWLLCGQAQAARSPIEAATLASTYKSTCRVSSQGASVCTEHLITTILKPAGRDQMSRIELLGDAFEPLVIKDAAVVRPDGKRIPLPASQIEIQRGSSEAGQPQTRTTLLFQGLEVGSSIDYTAETTHRLRPGMAQFHSSTRIPPSDIRLDHYRSEYIADRPMIWRGEYLGYLKVTAADGGKRIAIDNQAPLYFQVENEQGAIFRKVPRFELGFTADAQAHFKVIAERYADVLANALPAKAATAVDAVKAQREQARALAIIRYIADNYRYLDDYRADDRSYIPFPLAKVEANGYGDCKDLSMLLVAMLRAGGIAAEPAFVMRGMDAPPLLMPTPGAANHVLVRAVVGGATWWIDPTNPAFLPEVIPSDIQDRWAIVLGKDGKVRVDAIPLVPVDSKVSGSREERLLGDTTSVVDGQASIQGGVLLHLMTADRNQGTKAGDDGMCGVWVDESGQCQIDRPATADWPGGPYKFKLRVDNRKPLERLGNRYIYERNPLVETLEEFAQYRRGKAVGDLFLGDTREQIFHNRLSGLLPEHAMAPCQVSSPWYDLDIAPEATGKTKIAYTYRISQKVRWLTHEDLMSERFGRFLDEAQQCSSHLKLAVSAAR